MARAIETVGTTLTVGGLNICAVTISGLGVDNNEPIDVTTLCNTEWITKQANKLKEVPNISLTGLYTCEEWNDVEALVGVNSLCYLEFEDFGSFTFWGYIKHYTSDPAGKGESLNFACEIVVTSMNSSDVETGPVCTES